MHGRVERRTRRSNRAHEALALQLERVRGEARLDALVLATEEGLPIAHSGEQRLCDELAARAPFLSVEQCAGIKKKKTRVRAVHCLGLPLYLVSYCIEHPPQIDEWLEHASRGVTRILAA